MFTALPDDLSRSRAFVPRRLLSSRRNSVPSAGYFKLDIVVIVVVLIMIIIAVEVNYHEINRY